MSGSAAMRKVTAPLPPVRYVPAAESRWPSLWPIVADDSLGWKDTRAWHVFYRAVRPDGSGHYSERIVRCGGAASAVTACRVATAGLFVRLEIYRVTPPPTRQRVRELERVNAWIREK